MKDKLCKICKNDFSPLNSLQKVCSMGCALEFSKQQRERVGRRAQRAVEAAKRKSNRVAREKIKTRSQHLREAQREFNNWVRFRDRRENCISCGRHHNGQYHAGHYRSVGACPELRFNPDNVHKQCSACNNHLSGNAIDYRIRLVEKIGIARVEALEGPHEPRKYTIEEIKSIKAEYKEKLKELKEGPKPL